MPLQKSTIISLPLSLCLSLSPHTMLQQMTDIILINPKNLFKFLEHFNIINYRATSDPQHLDVQVARISKDKTHFFTLNLTLSLILSF